MHQLYAAVTQYVRNEMRNLNNLAGDDKRRNNVGFALQILQRRLASSPAAIYHSLRRRRERLEARLAEERIIARGGRLQKQEPLPALFDDEEDRELDEAGGAELEEAEQQIADRATSAQTIPELEAELVVLRELEKLADQLRKSGQDAKWRQLAEILDKPPMLDEATGQRRKLLIFTEPRDTLEYLADKIRQRIGKYEAVAIIHGGVPRDVSIIVSQKAPLGLQVVAFRSNFAGLRKNSSRRFSDFCVFTQPGGITDIARPPGIDRK